MNKLIKELIKKYAKDNAIPENILFGMAFAESNFNPKAYRYEPAFYKRYIKDKGKYPYEKEPKKVSASYGIYQLMFITAYDMGYRGKPEGLYDPDTNIYYACKYWKFLYDKFPEIKDEKERHKFVVAAYNAGRGSINKMLVLARKSEGKQIFDTGQWQNWIWSSQFLHQVTGKDNSNTTIRHIRKVFNFILPEKGLAEIDKQDIVVANIQNIPCDLTKSKQSNADLIAPLSNIRKALVDIVVILKNIEEELENDNA